MLDLGQLRELVICPALRDIGLWSQAAEELLIGTGLVESNFTYLRQLPDGPALGFWQMEPATHHDLWINWLCHQPLLVDDVLNEISDKPLTSQIMSALGRGWRPAHTLLVTNLRYAVMVARLQYYRRPEPLPAPDDIEGLAHYWKAHWNTPAGRGKPATFVLLYREHALTNQ